LNSKLKWDEISREPHASMLRWYKDLIALRRESPILTDGRLWQVDVEFDEEARWLIVTRGSLQIFCNFSDNPQCLQLAIAKPNVLSSEERGWEAEGDRLLLPPESVIIARAAGKASTAYHFVQHTAG
jgi:maltooligosyltrehalose trehalohydrolase